MAYGYFTDKYSLPAQVKGDIMSEREEKRKARIIDNQLYATLLLHSAGYGVISEGTYSGTFSANNSRVDLTSLEALINQVYVSPTSTLSWTGIPNNVTFYLYVTLVEQATDTSPEGASSREYKNVAVTTNTTGIIPANSILLATATTTASAITVTTNPTGKRTIVTVADHDLHGSGVDAYNDSTFRGDVAIQDTLSVEDDSTLEYLLVRSGEDVYGNSIFHGDVTITADLVVRGNNNNVFISAGSGLDIGFYNAQGTKIAFMDAGGNLYLKGQSYNNVV